MGLIDVKIIIIIGEPENRCCSICKIIGSFSWGLISPLLCCPGSLQSFQDHCLLSVKWGIKLVFKDSFLLLLCDAVEDHQPLFWPCFAPAALMHALTSASMVSETWSMVIINENLILNTRLPFPWTGEEEWWPASLLPSFMPWWLLIENQNHVFINERLHNLKFKTSFPLNTRERWIASLLSQSMSGSFSYLPSTWHRG